MSSLTEPTPKDGTIDFTYNGETFQTYYKTYGDISDRSKCPLLVCHGGPGIVHNYLISHWKLTVQHGIPIILYDQLGNGKSTHLKDKAPEFWTVDLFVAELINLIKHFNIQDHFDFLGHSWGGMLGSEFAVRTQMPGLKHLIITNAPASDQLWVQSLGQLLKKFPPHVTEGIMAGTKEPEKLQKALGELHAVHGCTVESPEEYKYTMAQVFGPDADRTVMSAPVKTNWSIVGRLGVIKTPTLLINGKDDMAQGFTMQPFFNEIEKVKWIVFGKSAHLPIYEEHEKYMQDVAGFLMN